MRERMKHTIKRLYAWYIARQDARIEREAELLHMPKKRLLAMPKRHWYNPFTWGRRVPLPPRQKLSSVWGLWRKTWHLILGNWRAMLGTTAVYGLGLFVFVQSFDLSGLALSASTASSNALVIALDRAGELAVNASTSISAASGAYQLIIGTVGSLTLIWILRKTLAHERVRTKQALYEASRPLVPYLLVLAWIGLQLVPLAIVGYLYSFLPALYLLGWQMAIATALLILVVLWTFRMLTHSIFALFIVTLPNMTPMKALSSAKKMVFRRRLLLWRKLTGYSLILILIAVLVLSPFLVWLPGTIPIVFFILTVLGFVVSQTLLFVLYREIL